MVGVSLNLDRILELGYIYIFYKVMVVEKPLDRGQRCTKSRILAKCTLNFVCAWLRVWNKNTHFMQMKAVYKERSRFCWTKAYSDNSKEPNWHFEKKKALASSGHFKVSFSCPIAIKFSVQNLGVSCYPDTSSLL